MMTKRAKRKSVYEYDQPFDLFEGFENGPGGQSRQATKEVQSEPSFSSKRMIAVLAFLSMLLVGSGVVGYMTRTEEVRSFVLIELRSINDTGHPVAGATVYLEGKKFGVTDSFGEWRRYMRLKPGRDIEVLVHKKGRGGQLMEARKSLVTPELSANRRDSELRVTLELNESKKQSPMARRNSDDKADDRIVELDSPELSQALDGDLDEKKKPSGEAMKSSQDLSSIDIYLKPFTAKRPSLMEAHQSRVLSAKILPEMVAQAHEDGLKISKNAPWKLAISYVPYKGRVGFVKGEVTFRQGDRQYHRTFIRNFSKTITETAVDLLKLAKVHVNRSYLVYQKRDRWFVAQEGQAKFWNLRHGLRLMNAERKLFAVKSNGDDELFVQGEPCGRIKSQCYLLRPSTKEVPPHLGWESFKLRFSGDLPQGSQVYINGFRAYRKQGHFAYWAKGGVSHSLMVMSDSQILFRTKVVPSKLQVLEINLPQKIARR